MTRAPWPGQQTWQRSSSTHFCIAPRKSSDRRISSSISTQVKGTNILQCVEVAFLLRDVLTELRLKSFPKVSGSKGIQVYVPLRKIERKLPIRLALLSEPHARKPAKALAAYHAKPNFAKHAEPTAAFPKRSAQGRRPRWVVQEHAASDLHADFRPEIHDVL